MKNLITLLFVTLSLSISAADLSFISDDKFASTKLKSIAKASLLLDESLEDGVVLYKYGYKINSVKPNESVVNTIKQMLYSTGGSYGPTDVSVSLVSKYNLNNEFVKMEESIESTIVDYDYGPEHSADIRKGFKKLKSVVYKNSKNLKFYTTDHSGYFYFAGGLAIYNKNTKEVLFIEIAYEE